MGADWRADAIELLKEYNDNLIYEKIPASTTIYVKDEISKYLKNSKTIDNKLYAELMNKYKF